MEVIVKCDRFSGDKLLFEKTLFNQTKDEDVVKTKNFTLIFKYIGSETSPNITGAVFNVKNANVNSH